MVQLDSINQWVTGKSESHYDFQSSVIDCCWMGWGEKIRLSAIFSSRGNKVTSTHRVVHPSTYTTSASSSRSFSGHGFGAFQSHFDFNFLNFQNFVIMFHRRANELSVCLSVFIIENRAPIIGSMLYTNIDISIYTDIVCLFD